MVGASCTSVYFASWYWLRKISQFICKYSAGIRIVITNCFSGSTTLLFGGNSKLANVTFAEFVNFVNYTVDTKYKDLKLRLIFIDLHKISLIYQGDAYETLTNCNAVNNFSIELGDVQNFSSILSSWYVSLSLVFRIL